MSTTIQSQKVNSRVSGDREKPAAARLIPGNVVGGTTRLECNGKTVSGTVLRKTDRTRPRVGYGTCAFKRGAGGLSEEILDTENVDGTGGGIELATYRLHPNHININILIVLNLSNM